MNFKILIMALSISMGMTGFIPSEAVAKSKNKHAKKTIKKLNKRNNKLENHLEKAHHNSRSYGHWDHKRGNDHWDHNDRHWNNGRVKIKYKYDYPDRDSEQWGIYTSPSGGLGFYYSESEGSPYGYPYGYRGYRYY